MARAEPSQVMSYGGTPGRTMKVRSLSALFDEQARTLRNLPGIAPSPDAVLPEPVAEVDREQPEEVEGPKGKG